MSNSSCILRFTNFEKNYKRKRWKVVGKVNYHGLVEYNASGYEWFLLAINESCNLQSIVPSPLFYFRVGFALLVFILADVWLIRYFCWVKRKKKARACWLCSNIVICQVILSKWSTLHPLLWKVYLVHFHYHFEVIGIWWSLRIAIPSFVAFRALDALSPRVLLFL